MLLAKNSLQKVALIMLRMIRNLVALMIVRGVRGTFKVDSKVSENIRPEGFI
jgi:hypothetical protein